MRRITTQSWTPEQIELLRGLAAKGASPLRASVALKRSRNSVGSKARELGIPFPPKHKLKREREAREALTRAALGLPHARTSS
jgi:hypothetical protein